MIIRYTHHARLSIQKTVARGFLVTDEIVAEVLCVPDMVDVVSRFPETVAQRRFDDAHVLRVVYRKEFNYALVITVYIGRRKQYER